MSETMAVSLIVLGILWGVFGGVMLSLMGVNTVKQYKNIKIYKIFVFGPIIVGVKWWYTFWEDIFPHIAEWFLQWFEEDGKIVRQEESKFEDFPKRKPVCPPPSPTGTLPPTSSVFRQLHLFGEEFEL